jgi:hypothetical protein
MLALLVQYYELHPPNRHWYGLYMCHCGNLKIADNCYANKRTKSCGCLRQEVSRRRMSERNKSRKGQSLSEETKRKISLAHKGKKQTFIPWNKNPNPNHKLILHRIRNSTEYVNWRTAVYKRDNFTCQDCDYPDLRFDMENGLTLCSICHKNTDNFPSNLRGSK